MCKTSLQGMYWILKRSDPHLYTPLLIHTQHRLGLLKLCWVCEPDQTSSKAVPWVSANGMYISSSLSQNMSYCSEKRKWVERHASPWSWIGRHLAASLHMSFIKSCNRKFRSSMTGCLFKNLWFGFQTLAFYQELFKVIFADSEKLLFNSNIWLHVSYHSN